VCQNRHILFFLHLFVIFVDSLYLCCRNEKDVPYRENGKSKKLKTQPIRGMSSQINDQHPFLSLKTRGDASVNNAEGCRLRSKSWTSPSTYKRMPSTVRKEELFSTSIERLFPKVTWHILFAYIGKDAHHRESGKL